MKCTSMPMRKLTLPDQTPRRARLSLGLKAETGGTSQNKL